jgi:hypothetical protein
MPLLAVFGALGAVHTWRRLPAGRLRTAVVGSAALLHVSGMAWSFPDYLGDFNALVGGRKGGERISIVGEEWGQDASRLGRLAREHGIRQLLYNGSPFTARDELRRQRVIMKRAGCREVLPPHSYIAVSARDRARDRRGCWSWVHGRTPYFDVDNHVFVYRTGALPELVAERAKTRRDPDSDTRAEGASIE